MLLEETVLRASLVPDLESMIGRICSVSDVAEGDWVAVGAVDVTASIEVPVVEVGRVLFTSEGFGAKAGPWRSSAEEDGTLALGVSADEGLMTSAEEDGEEMFVAILVLASVMAASSMLRS